MLVLLATISHLLLHNLMRSDPRFSEERSLYDAFLIFCFRIDDFSGRTRLINADAILKILPYIRRPVAALRDGLRFVLSQAAVELSFAEQSAR